MAMGGFHGRHGCHLWIFFAVIISICICVLGSSSPKDPEESEIKHVHVIFMNHLDVGYDGLLPAEIGFINNVLNKYFTEYFPRAIYIAKYLRAAGFFERFIYTTHPWLVSLYLDCPPNLVLSGILLKCPTKKEKEDFIDAVKHGDITWHAGPMNMQMEVIDQSLTRFGLQLAVDLDRKLNINRKHKTLSQRDVPGTTQALIPILNEFGIEAISVGVNTVTAPPDLPPIFNWKFGNSSVIGIWHPGGYPEIPGKLPLMPGGMSKKDCATFPGVSHALCFAFRTDNSGPPVDYKEVLNNFEIARSQFPGAVVQASTFEDFVAALQTVKSKLPVVTKEIGDTWIQGTASDPRKVAEMRAVMRARTKCLTDNTACSLTDPRVYNSSRFMLKLGEHTWGLSSVFDSVHWSNVEFYQHMYNESFGFSNGTLSWEEQRNFTYMAMESLGNHSLAREMEEELKQINAKKPDLSGYSEVKNPLAVQTCENGFRFQFSKQGYLTQLWDPMKLIKKSWASVNAPIGKFVYQTLNQSDFDYFNQNYPYSGRFQLGIGKPNISKNVNASSQVWDQEMSHLFRSSDGCSFVVALEMSDPSCHYMYGAPLQIFIKYDAVMTLKPESAKVDVELLLFNKPPTRMPESIYFIFQPVAVDNMSWKLHKLGQMIDPLNVIQNGSQRHHAVDTGVYYTDPNNIGLEVVSPDVALVNILTPKLGPSAIPLPLTPIESVSGMAFNLYNNIWDVNWIFWYPFEQRDMDQKFRFTMNFLTGRRKL